MSKKQNEYGGGNDTNASGLTFETYVFNVILEQLKAEGFDLEIFSPKPIASSDRIFKISKEEKLKAIIGNQNTIFKWLGQEENFKRLSKEFIPSKKLKEVWSKDLEPDIVMLVLEPEPKIHIFEVKYQNCSGSVDEKLQTARYKKEMWLKLFKQIFDNDTDITYSYFLSNWFGKSSKKPDIHEYMYGNTFKFLDENKIEFYINQNIDYDVIEKINSKGKKIKKSKFKKHETVFNKNNGDEFSIKKYL